METNMQRIIFNYVIPSLFLIAALYITVPKFLNTNQSVEVLEAAKYITIDTPVAPDSNDKIEVTEIFWYGCPHCNAFRPFVDEWKIQQTDDVSVKRLPAMWNKKMVIHARIFYTAQTFGKLDIMHQEIFEAMHSERLKLTDENEIYALFKKHNISKSDFASTFNSEAITKQVEKADKLAKRYGNTGTPEIVVNGKYRITGQTAGSHSNALKVTDELIEKERNENKS